MVSKAICCSFSRDDAAAAVNAGRRRVDNGIVVEMRSAQGIANRRRQQFAAFHVQAAVFDHFGPALFFLPDTAISLSLPLFFTCTQV
jgi:hypothetical protein